MSSIRFARRALAPTMLLGAFLAACAPSAVERTAVEPAATEAVMDDAAPTGEAMMEDAMPAFFSVALTDVASGAGFKLADFKGKVVLLEPFAQWCPKCLAQQREVVRLRALLGSREDFVVVGLDIDPNEDAAMLRDYLSGHGFDWWYAVAPAEVAREIGEMYGSQFLNPPSTPILLIDRHGVVHPLDAGAKSAETLQTVVEPLLAEPM